MSNFDDITTHYKKKRVEFGRAYQLIEAVNTRPIVNVDPDPELRQKYVEINPFSLGSQASSEYSQHQVNTEVTQTKLEDIIHREGGWPAGIDPTNAPSCKQTRMKLEKREKFPDHLKTLANTTEKCLQLNHSLNLYTDHFEPREQTGEIVDPMLRTVGVFRDPKTSRFISTISWQQESTLSRRVAICYTPQELAAPNVSYESYIYNLECPSMPETTLHPPSPLCCLEYNTKDSNFLVGGMSHGSLALWDIRQGSLPVWISAIESSHRQAVTSAKWISSKTAFECISCSPDGVSMTWDTRSNTAPIEVVNLTATEDLIPPGFNPPFGGQCLDYHTGVPTKFMVGTVEGLVLAVNRKSSDPNNRISGVFPGHYGPVYAVRRHPTDTKYFASVSDWSVRIWTEDNKSPLLSIPAQMDYLTNAVWGTTRTSVIYTSNTAGRVDAWDLIQNLKDPICSIQVGSSSIQTMGIETSGQFILTGDMDGTATLLELNEPLRTITPTEKSLFTSMMSREAKRVKNYDQFQREQKMRDKARERAAQNKPDDEAPKEDKFSPDEIEREFDAALRGEAEVVVEKKRIVIGEEDAPPAGDDEPEEEQQDAGHAAGILGEISDALTADKLAPAEEPQPPTEEEQPAEEPAPPAEEQPAEEPAPPAEEEQPAEEPAPPAEEEQPAEEPAEEEQPAEEVPPAEVKERTADGGIFGEITNALTTDTPPAQEPEQPAEEEPQAPAEEEPQPPAAEEEEQPPAAEEEPPAEVQERSPDGGIFGELASALAPGTESAPPADEQQPAEPSEEAAPPEEEASVEEAAPPDENPEEPEKESDMAQKIGQLADALDGNEQAPADDDNPLAAAANSLLG